MPNETVRLPESQPSAGVGAMQGAELSISGMTCQNCVRHVTGAIQGVPGVRAVTVDLDTARAKVRWEAGTEPDVDAVVKAVRKEGYGAKVAEPRAHDHGEHKLTGWRLNLLIGLPVTALLMVGEWGVGLATEPWFQWLSFVLAIVVQAFAGARFYRGAWGQLRVGGANMDTLVALGSTTAFGYSAWALLAGQGGHLYFMEAASIITLISVGHWMESLVSVRASSALRKLLSLAPEMARRRNADGSETETAVADLKRGDIVALRPGDRVPTDGKVTEGDSAVDESMLTGESAPVDKAAGAELYAGTVNLNGRLLMEVTATGEETALSHIIAAVQRAQSSRANIQRLGDRVSSIFVPVVVLIALGAALWWGFAPGFAEQAHQWLAQFVWQAHPPMGLAAGFIIAAAVLIIACPCAMGLATPAAIMAGSNAAAQRGILIRDGVALEKAGRVTAVVFDKTGTLTIGKPAVVEVKEIKDGKAGVPAGDSTALVLAADLARHSTHPISQAVAAASQSAGNNQPAAKSRESSLSGWQEVAGAGVVAQMRLGLGLPGMLGVGSVLAFGNAPAAAGPTVAVRLGSLKWLGESGVDVAPGKAFAEEWSGQGATTVGLASGNSLRCLFAVKDTVKAGAAGVVAQLRRQGLDIYLVTGDNPLTAASIAKAAGIQSGNVFAEVRPERKAEFVKRLQQQGRRVAFVGDGINDAPALEQADLGIAVSRASDIAREAADIILLKSEIEAVPESLGLARATLRTIKQNLFWAFFYNAIGIPLAALGFMSPILCAAAMGLSDLVVIGNALRLRWWRL